jgi:hypothetical protein
MTTAPKASERRDGPRIDLRLRVRWSATTSAGPVSGEAEASDVSPKGLRLESEHQLENASDLDLVVDVGGDADELTAKGKVMWCRLRESPTGRSMYDVGVAFESDWLAKDRGPLGQALARIFSMNSYEPARTFERTEVHLSVASSGPLSGGTLTMVNLSGGGMQVSLSGGNSDIVRAGIDVEVTVSIDGADHAFAGRVAWVAANANADADAGDRFGVEFVDVNAAAAATLEKIRVGDVQPTRVAMVLKA